MLLTVDVGNTHTHLGTFLGTELTHMWRFRTTRKSTADELAIILRNLLTLKKLSFSDIDAGIVSSTVPELRAQWQEMSMQCLNHDMLVVGPGVKVGMPIRIDNPHELGPDRIVNAVAAYEQFHRPCLVVDFGTAITFDAVSGAGEYLGGVIAPGMEISVEALSERAAALARIDLNQPKTVIGKSSVEAIRSGVIYGFAGLVDGIVRRIKDEQNEPNQLVVATGGYAETIAPYCDSIDLTDNLLTLTGLRLVWERNR